MIYTAMNVENRTRVYNADSVTVLDLVMSVDTDTNEVTQAYKPLRLDGDGVATYITRFKAIHPIYGGYYQPCLFCCYGEVL